MSDRHRNASDGFASRTRASRRSIQTFVPTVRCVWPIANVIGATVTSVAPGQFGPAVSVAGLRNSVGPGRQGAFSVSVRSRFFLLSVSVPSPSVFVDSPSRDFSSRLDSEKDVLNLIVFSVGLIFGTIVDVTFVCE